MIQLSSHTVSLEHVLGPRRWGLSPQAWPPQFQMPIFKPSCQLCFWPHGYKSEVSMTFSLVLIDLLGRLPELRETFYLLDYQFIIKGYNSGTARWKRCTGRGVGRRHGVSMPSLSWVPLSPNLQVISHPEAPQMLSFVFSMEASLCRCGWLDHWPMVTDSTSSLLPLPGKLGGWDWTFHPSGHDSFPWQPAPKLGVSNGHLININSGVVDKAC